MMSATNAFPKLVSKIPFRIAAVIRTPTTKPMSAPSGGKKKNNKVKIKLIIPTMTSETKYPRMDFPNVFFSIPAIEAPR